MPTDTANDQTKTPTSPASLDDVLTNAELPEEVRLALEAMQQVKRVQQTTVPRREPDYEYFRVT